MRREGLGGALGGAERQGKASVRQRRVRRHVPSLPDDAAASVLSAREPLAVIVFQARSSHHPHRRNARHRGNESKESAFKAPRKLCLVPCARWWKHTDCQVHILPFALLRKVINLLL